MNIIDAVRYAENNEDVKKLYDFFLGSAFTCITEDENITEWTLIFYNPKTNRTIDCCVNDNFITLGEETQALSKFEKLNVLDIKISVEDAIDRAKSDVKKGIVNILITLHKKEIPIWRIGVVTNDIAITSFDINAINGEIIKKEETSLIREVK
ncbi:MAG: PepSY domain-containing protein [Candidatus Aenigmatarchaeota archaeon]